MSGFRTQGGHSNVWQGGGAVRPPKGLCSSTNTSVHFIWRQGNRVDPCLCFARGAGRRAGEGEAPAEEARDPRLPVPLPGQQSITKGVQPASNSGIHTHAPACLVHQCSARRRASSLLLFAGMNLATAVRGSRASVSPSRFCTVAGGMKGRAPLLRNIFSPATTRAVFRTLITESLHLAASSGLDAPPPLSRSPGRVLTWPRPTFSPRAANLQIAMQEKLVASSNYFKLSRVRARATPARYCRSIIQVRALVVSRLTTWTLHSIWRQS